MAWPAGYTILPLLPSGTFAAAYAVSGNGLVAVGEADDVTAERAVYWTIDAGPVDLGFLPGGQYAIGQSANSDGSVIVGYGDATDGKDHAWRWTAGGGMVALPVPMGATNSYAYGISDDGTVIVGEFIDGSGHDHACYWLNSAAPVDIGYLPGGSIAFAVAVSADGSVIVGQSDSDGGTRAFRWTQAGGMVDLGLLTGTNSRALAVSADGSVVAGAATIADNTTVSFRWTSGTGMVDLGHLGTVVHPSGAGGCTDTIVVGRATDDDFHALPFTWTEAGGMVALPLPDGGAASGYDAYAIALDGSVLVGDAPINQSELTPGEQGVYWTLADGHVHYLETPATAGSYASAMRASDDGSIIVGYVFDAGDSTTKPAMWTDGALTVLAAATPTMFYAYDVSGDGSTILSVGSGGSVYWTASGTVAHTLPIIPGDDIPTGARVQEPQTAHSGSRIMSTDGSKIIGTSLHNNFPSPSTATGVVWTNGTITTSLPNTNNPGGVFLIGCSSDGISTIAGQTFDGSAYQPCIWLGGTVQHDLVGGPLQAVSCDESGTVVCLEGGIYVDSLSTNHGGTPNLYGNAHTRDTPMGYLPGLQVQAFAAEDNLLAVGVGNDGSNHNKALSWNGTTVTPLAELAGWVVSFAVAMSGDGSVAVGSFWAADGINQPTYWDGNFATGGTAHLLDNPFPTANATVNHVSRDGTIGVGFVTVPSPITTAFVYSFATPTPPDFPLTGVVKVLLPPAELQFCDANGTPYAGGTLEFYQQDTSTPKDTWNSPLGGDDHLNSNPLTLDAAGRALIYGDGGYRTVLRDADGNLVWDQPSFTYISACMVPVVGAATLADAREAMGITAAIEAEAIARAAADSAEQTARIAADVALQAAIDAEVARAEAAEAALQAEIDALPPPASPGNVQSAGATLDASGHAHVTFGAPFATNGIAVVITGQAVGVQSGAFNVANLTRFGFDVWGSVFGSRTPASGIEFYWMATGD